ncbi:MAG TPA: HAD family hydrolase [Firmicutes bacterium]|uniref:HAD family hydrolase n=1 Tax=candidate division TA06 bacterium TaxID=2250710 RepID=A0A660SAQ0_UNCT6|nr:MAG: HAD family hydrolase [candidate division TA06 bacterium]HFD05280.1 HAD family hydrolase [Bacillota bacterium]
MRQNGGNMDIKLPGRGMTNIKNLIFDFNGTLTENRKLSEAGREVLETLSQKYAVYVATSDTFGNAKEELKGLNVKIVTVKSGSEKLELVMKLGYASTIAIGNGNNDKSMLKKAVVGIAVIGRDGATPDAINSADIVIGNIKNIIPLLKNRDLIFSVLRK